MTLNEIRDRVKAARKLLDFIRKINWRPNEAAHLFALSSLLEVEVSSLEADIAKVEGGSNA